METWRPVVGFDGYEVGDLGHVRSLERRVPGRYPGSTRRIGGIVLTPTITAAGYRQVGLYAERKLYTRLVHALVAYAFLGDPPTPDHMVCHCEGDFSDNAATSLYWGTSEDNNRDLVRHGRHHEARRTHCDLGHRLVEPNLCAWAVAKGERACLSCSRARNNVRKVPGRDLRAWADWHYGKIMA